MNRCAICDRQLTTYKLRSSSSKKTTEPAPVLIHCRGPVCGGTTSVHGGCLNLPGPVLEALSAELGIFWACDRCRQGEDGGGGLSELGPPRKLARKRKERILPVEVLVRIFELLTEGELLRVRMTCTYWRDAVDESKRLRDRLEVKFPKGVLMDWRYKPERMMLFAGKVSFQRARLFRVGSWWKRFGAGLTEITLENGKCLFWTLTGMLRETPNLKVLTWNNVMMDEFNSETADFSFRLDKLESLTFVSIFDIEILTVFRKLCPNLKQLSLDYQRKFESFEPYEHMIDLVQAVQDSLEKLSLSCTENVLNRILVSTQLNLTKLELEGEEMKDTSVAVEFCRKMPTLKDLRFKEGFPMRESNLDKIGQLLPNLQRFAGYFPEQRRVRPTFLNHMTNLRHLTLVANDNISEIQTINFTGFSCPNLTHLDLQEFEFPQDSLHQLLANSPHITDLSLKNVHFASYHHLFEALVELSRLEHLLLDSVVSPKSQESTWMQTPANYSDKILSNLRHLKVERVKFGEPALLTLLGLCPPQLSRLALHRVEEVGLEVQQLVRRKFSQLDELILVDCYLWPDEERSLLEHFRLSSRTVRVLRIVDERDYW